MGEPWRDTEAWSVVDTIAALSGHDVADLLLAADDETLRRTDRAQISTFAIEMVMLRHASTDGAVACAGHSLGEYSALVAAGALDLEAAARLVAARGAAMLATAQDQPGTMVAVLGAPDDDLADAIAKVQAGGARVWIANYNAPGQTVLAGDADGIAAATTACGALPRTKVRSLPVGGAFHSPLMEPAAETLRTALAETTFTDGARPVVANVDATPHNNGADWPGLLGRQLTAPVRWTESVRTLVDLGCTRFVEIGPGDTIASMVKRIARDVPITPVAR